MEVSKCTRADALSDLVQLLVELRELCGLGHHLLVHHEWWLEISVPFLAQEVKAVRDKSLIEVDTVVREEVASVTSDLRA